MPISSTVELKVTLNCNKSRTTTSYQISSILEMKYFKTTFLIKTTIIKNDVKTANSGSNHIDPESKSSKDENT